MRVALLSLLALLPAALLTGCATSEPPAPSAGGDEVAPPSQSATTPSVGDVVPLPTVEPPSAVRARALHAMRSTTAGRDVSFAIELTARETSDVLVRLENAVAAGETTTRLVATIPLTVFVTVHVADDAPAGSTPIAIAVSRDGEVLLAPRDVATLRVLAPTDATYAAPASAMVTYTGRAEGSVFNTNDPALGDATFARTPAYSFSRGVLTVRSVPEPTVVPGFFEALLGMQEGESRTVTFPPEKGYGSNEERVPRDETLPRTMTVRNDVQRVPRQQFDEYIVESGQGDPATFEGRVFHFDDGPSRWPYRVTRLGNDTVEYRLEVNVGERYTIYPVWHNASEVIAADDAEVTFRTTPTTAAGAPITFHAKWPAMSAVLRVDDESIVLRHSPPPGTTYTEPDQARIVERTVARLEEDVIVVTSEGGHPLAGLTLTFDVFLMDILEP